MDFDEKAVLLCQFCGGESCPQEDFKANKIQPNAIEGLHSNWITHNILAMQRPSDRLIKEYNLYHKFKNEKINTILNLQEPGEVQSDYSLAPVLRRWTPGQSRLQLWPRGILRKWNKILQWELGRYDCNHFWPHDENHEYLLCFSHPGSRQDICALPCGSREDSASDMFVADLLG